MGKLPVKVCTKTPNNSYYSQAKKTSKLIHNSSPRPPHEDDTLYVDKTPTYHLDKIS
jgi:hypothetical protein